MGICSSTRRQTVSTVAVAGEHSPEVEVESKRRIVSTSRRLSGDHNRASIRTVGSNVSAGGYLTLEERYSISDTMLGRGGEAIVFEGIDKFTMERVAIKTVPRENQKGAESLKKEVEILRKLKHKYIMAFHDFFEEEQRFLLIVECATGGSLFDRMKVKKKYTEDAARHLLRNLSQAVKYLHDRDIVHRDLKCENVLMKTLDSDTHILIADFGYAAVTSEDTLTEQIGTANYVAPEVLQRIPYGKAVDIWALGIILYILLSGTFPFSHPNQITLFTMIMKAEISFESSRGAWVIFNIHIVVH